MKIEQALEHYRKGCNIRIPLDFIVDGWLTFKSGDEVSVLPIHINSNRWEAYGLQGWTPTPIFTPEDYNPSPTESVKYETMGDVIDKVFKILFSDIRGVLNKMPSSPSVEYIAKELQEIWGLVYVDIPKAVIKRIEEVRKEERANGGGRMISEKKEMSPLEYLRWQVENCRDATPNAERKEAYRKVLRLMDCTGSYDDNPHLKFATESLVYSIEEIVDIHTTEIFALEGRVNKLEDKIKIQNMAKEMLERIKILEESK
jgi:hypothetical protein